MFLRSVLIKSDMNCAVQKPSAWIWQLVNVATATMQTTTAATFWQQFELRYAELMGNRLTAWGTASPSQCQDGEKYRGEPQNTGDRQKHKLQKNIYKLTSNCDTFRRLKHLLQLKLKINKLLTTLFAYSYHNIK